MNEKRKTVLVLFGGCSTEYSVSLQSAYAVLTHIDESLYETVPVGIDHNGQWYWYKGDIRAIPEDNWYRQEADHPKLCIPVVVSPDKTLHRLLVMEETCIIKKPVDAAFPVLHGKNGEDGTVQGVLELAGIPVVGCGTLCSAVGMDKEMAHRIVQAAGVRVPESVVLDAWPVEEEKMRAAAALLNYPLFIKPVRSGSSFGITKVACAEQLPSAIAGAFDYDDSVILEEAIEGFEVGCAILGNQKPVTGEVDEIELADGFFDYTEKYTLKTSAIHVPARISEEMTKKVKKTAVKIYRALKCRGFARVDLFLTGEGELVFNEINTVPGMTVHSRYPQMMEKAGIPFEQVIGRLLSLSLGEGEG